MEVPVILPSKPTGDEKRPSAEIKEPSDLADALEKKQPWEMPTKFMRFRMKIYRPTQITKLTITSSVGSNVQVEKYILEDGQDELNKVNCLYKSCWKI